MLNLQNKRMLIVFVGEAFRGGGKGCRQGGDSGSITEQMHAFNTHYSFLIYLKNTFDIVLDTAIETYTTQYDEIFLDTFKPFNLIHYNFYERQPHDYKHRATKPFKRAYVTLKNYIINYDYIMFIRPDLIIKDHFIKCFKPNDEKVVLTNPMGVYHKDHVPKVADLMICVPRAHFSILAHMNHLTHSMIHWLCVSHSFDYDNIEFLDNSHYATNSQNYWNPFFLMANRPAIKPNSEIIKTFNSDAYILYDKFDLVQIRDLSKEIHVLSQFIDVCGVTATQLLNKEVDDNDLNNFVESAFKDIIKDVHENVHKKIVQQRINILYD